MGRAVSSRGRRAVSRSGRDGFEARIADSVGCGLLPLAGFRRGEGRLSAVPNARRQWRLRLRNQRKSARREWKLSVPARLFDHAVLLPARSTLRCRRMLPARPDAVLGRQLRHLEPIDREDHSQRWPVPSYRTAPAERNVLMVRERRRLHRSLLRHGSAVAHIRTGWRVHLVGTSLLSGESGPRDDRRPWPRNSAIYRDLLPRGAGSAA